MKNLVKAQKQLPKPSAGIMMPLLLLAGEIQ